MGKYSIDYIFCDGDYEVWINTNYVINAESTNSALVAAKDIEGIICSNIKSYFDNDKKDIFVKVKDNCYFDKAFITDYLFYDRTKDTNSKNSLSDEEIKNMYTNYSKEGFIKVLQERYKNYFKEHSILTFESIAYGVENCE
jgi:hypothetical protein